MFCTVCVCVCVSYRHPSRMVALWVLCLQAGLYKTQLNCRKICRLRLKCDGTRAETRFRLSVKRTSPFKSAVASVQSTTGSRGVSISGSNAGYTMFRGSVKGTGYPLHPPVSPSLTLLCVTVCHISNGVYFRYGSTSYKFLNFKADRP